MLLAFWAFSKPHSPLQYVVGGTLATSILLAGAFLQVLKRGYLDRRPRMDTAQYGALGADLQEREKDRLSKVARTPGRTTRAKKAD